MKSLKYSTHQSSFISRKMLAVLNHSELYFLWLKKKDIKMMTAATVSSIRRQLFFPQRRQCKVQVKLEASQNDHECNFVLFVFIAVQT